MACTLNDSLTYAYAPAYLAPYAHASRTSFPTQRPLSTQPRSPTTTATCLWALAALNSFPRVHRAVLRWVWRGRAPGVGGWGRDGTETSLKGSVARVPWAWCLFCTFWSRLLTPLLLPFACTRYASHPPFPQLLTLMLPRPRSASRWPTSLASSASAAHDRR
ncbi:hypothetical protein JB92DRAFT_3065123, partial [Gautieria morchelliformis]